jgi:hypothetical protein
MVPSTSTVSTRVRGRVRNRITKVQASTASSSTITGTLSGNRPNCTLRIQAALSSREAAIG